MPVGKSETVRQLVRAGECSAHGVQIVSGRERLEPGKIELACGCLILEKDTRLGLTLLDGTWFPAEKEYIDLFLTDQQRRMEKVLKEVWN